MRNILSNISISGIGIIGQGHFADCPQRSSTPLAPLYQRCVGMRHACQRICATSRWQWVSWHVWAIYGQTAGPLLRYGQAA